MIYTKFMLLLNSTKYVFQFKITVINIILFPYYTNVCVATQGEAGKPGVPGRDGVPGKEGLPGLAGKQVRACWCTSFSVLVFVFMLSIHCVLCTLCSFY